MDYTQLLYDKIKTMIYAAIGGILAYGFFIILEEYRVSHTKPLLLKGKINLEFVQKAQKLIESDTIIVDSTGGYVSHSLEAATAFSINSKKIIVDRWCTSACVEYILPAANKIEFRNSPIIGVHGNPLMFEFITKKHYPVVAEDCKFKYANATRELYRKIGYSDQIWKHQLNQLEISDPKFKMIDGCPVFRNKKYTFKFWYPNSRQLRSIFQLNFDGKVCADDAKCYKRVLSFHWPKGTKLKVGDDIYVTEGKIKAIFMSGR